MELEGKSIRFQYWICIIPLVLIPTILFKKRNILQMVCILMILDMRYLQNI